MKIEQIYTGCLAQGAYYIQCCGEAAIIDPLREVSPYLERAKKDGVHIKYIFETHFHADFVSGHVTLAEKTGAPIIYGPTANPTYDAHIAKDGEEFQIGKIKIRVLHTPGHTMESTTYLLIDKEGKEHAIFSGDTLFLGDVGRPDLAQKSADITQEQLAGMLYDSLRNKIMPLPDDLIVYPAHGAGSACGKNMMKETVDTLGNQKKVNYALRADMSKEEFIKEVTAGLLPPPAYFPSNVKMNKEGYESIDVVLENGMRALSPSDFEAMANETGAVMLDVRHQDEFAKWHIPRSIFIGLNGDFAPWVGALIKNVEQPILLIVEDHMVKEAVTRLSRVGFDNVIGFLKGGMKSWILDGKEGDTIQSISADELSAKMERTSSVDLIDVRRQSENYSEHVIGAVNYPLSSINEYLSDLPKQNQFYVYCAGGYRSMIANSILKSRGIHNAIDVKGGFKSIKESSISISQYLCPSTL